MSKVWTTEKILSVWEEGTIYPICKKEDQLECHNYKGIALLNSVQNHLRHVMWEAITICSWNTWELPVWIWNWEDSHWSDTALRHIMEKIKECNISTFHLFIEFKAAYNSIRKDILFMTMEKFENPYETNWPNEDTVNEGVA